MEQGWYGLLFAHWPYPAERMRAFVPKELELDTFGGEAWISLTPMRIRMRPRALTVLGNLWTFPELNCRTYVRHKGRAGIYFFSLDAGSRLAVMGARTLYRLPYFFARMEHREKDDGVLFRSERGDGPAQFYVRYQATQSARYAPRGSLEHWLVERYRLYTVAAGKVFHGDIHHEPWSLSQVAVEFGRDTVSRAAGFTLSTRPALAQYSARQEVLIWPLERS